MSVGPNKSLLVGKNLKINKRAVRLFATLEYATMSFWNKNSGFYVLEDFLQWLWNFPNCVSNSYLTLIRSFKSISPLMKKKEMKDALRNISDELGSSRIPIRSLYGTPEKPNYSPSPAKKAKTVRLDTESQVCNC